MLLIEDNIVCGVLTPQLSRRLRGSGLALLVRSPSLQGALDEFGAPCIPIHISHHKYSQELRFLRKRRFGEMKSVPRSLFPRVKIGMAFLLLCRT